MTKLHHGADLGPSVFIYGLTDPESGEVRYIGKSIRPHERWRNHINEKPTNCHRSHWIALLKARALEPGLIIIEELQGAWPWQEAERFWIARCRAVGMRLVNNTRGGDGVPGLPEETRERMRKVWLGRKHTPATLEKLRAARATRVTSDETRAKHSASMRGREILWTEKISQAVRKLSATDVETIRLRLARGERVTQLAREYAVHRTTLSKVKKGCYP